MGLISYLHDTDKWSSGRLSGVSRKSMEIYIFFIVFVYKKQRGQRPEKRSSAFLTLL